MWWRAVTTVWVGTPLAATQDERTLQLIQAAYRGVQDSRTAVRFFRKSVAEDEQPLGSVLRSRSPCLVRVQEVTSRWLQRVSPNYNDIILDDAEFPFLSSGTIQVLELKSQW